MMEMHKEGTLKELFNKIWLLIILIYILNVKIEVLNY